MFRWLITVGLLLPFNAMSETIPCGHRYAATKVRETFNITQAQTGTAVRATELEDARETGQTTISEHMLVRYCEGSLRLNSGEIVQVIFRLASRADYKRERAEDVQVCWRNKKFGSNQNPD